MLVAEFLLIFLELGSYKISDIIIDNKVISIHVTRVLWWCTSSADSVWLFQLPSGPDIMHYSLCFPRSPKLLVMIP